ncbi:MAG: hypothetical protein M9949_14685 [Candidatus Kapabacteria bacterium]|nr:hypothetical protein [Candidatus Kapabacteria bacterium]
MKKLLFFLPGIVLISLFFNFSLYGQNVPCYPEYQFLFYTIQTNQSNPPISTDMPLDVFIGYLAMDSLSKSISIKDFNDFLWQQTYNDTIKTMMRYFYKVIEYDPTIFLNFEMDASLGFLIGDFIEFIDGRSPYPVLDVSLLSSYFIGSVTVTFVYNYTDTSAVWARTKSLVTARIDSLIKGETPLICRNNLSINQTNNRCIQFEIAKEWFGQDTTEFSILPGQQYFIFGDYRYLCNVDSTNYYTILPLGRPGRRVYPIIENNLIDLDNELGFGVNVNINDFYNNINNRINEIKSFQP